VFAQGGGPQVPPDLVGEWRRLTNHEDAHERGPGPDPGEYWGLPLNDAARMRADTYNASWISTSPELQCRPHPTGYQQLGPDVMRIEKEINPLTRELVAYGILFQRTPGIRMVYLDGRPHPSEYAAHTWEGFSTGTWDGDTLTISATHLKESFIRRNGVQGSFRRTVTEHVSLDEPYLTWILIVNDPDYLTAPLIRSVTFVRNPTGQVPVYPCSPQLEDYKPDRVKDYVPHYLPGTNPYLSEVPVKYQVPIEGVRGGAETEYPEFQPKVKALSAPAAQFTLKPEYKDASTRIAELADAQPRREPNWNDQKVDLQHVQGNVYLLGGAGGNIALSAGEDGVVMIDSGVAQMSEKVLGAIQDVAQRPGIPLTRSSRASYFASTWQSTHTTAPAAIRMIINTSADSDHTGGNDKIAGSKIFHPIGVEGGDQSGSEVIVAHENVLQRMDALNSAKPDTVPARALPTTTYFSERYRLHRFVNGEGVEVIHLPNAHSDGDSMVYFRGSDVIVAGDAFNSDTYPDIDVEHGGSIQGVIDALIRITDLAYPEYMGQGGTMIIPGHGHISDIADAGYYRDMLIIVRDRVQDMIKKGMALQQIKAAKPTMDYDPLFGRQPGATAKFVEAVYRSLTQRKAQ
jgi:glyoxylase-like metal-dependent hydrolase (beta-lactamase superfamily II)